MPAQLGREDPLAVAPRGLLRQAGKARALPGAGIALHHEGAGVGRVAIVMRHEGPAAASLKVSVRQSKGWLVPYQIYRFDSASTRGSKEDR
jgi:hypothetical protein